MVFRSRADLRFLIALACLTLLSAGRTLAAPQNEVDKKLQKMSKSVADGAKANKALSSSVRSLEFTSGVQAGRIDNLTLKTAASETRSAQIAAQTESNKTAIQNLSQQLNTQINDRTEVINGEIQRSTVGGTIAGAIRSAKDDVTAASVARDNALGERLTTESAARTAADTSLSNQITAHGNQLNGVSAALTAEQNTRSANVAALTNNLNAEVAARTAADTSLSNQITAHGNQLNGVSTALTAEQNTLSANVAALTNNLNAERAERGAADTQLAQGLESERAARIADDVALTNGLNAERAARTAQDAAHTTNISSTATALTNEVNTRAAADTVLTQRTNANDSAIVAEREARTTALSQERTTSAQEIGAEATTRGTEDARLSAALGQVPANIRSAIESEAALRQAADSREITDRQAAISASETRITTAYNAAIAADIPLEGERTRSAIWSQAVSPLRSEIIPQMITAALGGFQGQLVQDYGLPPQTLSITPNAPYPGTTVGATDYYCQRISLAGYLDGAGRPAEVSLTVQKNTLITTNTVGIGQTDMRTGVMRLVLETPSARPASDPRRTASVVLDGVNVASKNFPATSTFNYLLGTNSAALMSFQGAPIANGALDIGTASLAQYRKFGLEITDSAGAVIARVVNGAPLKSSSGSVTDADNFGCANVTLSGGERGIAMQHSSIFKDPTDFVVQIRGDYIGKVAISKR